MSDPLYTTEIQQFVELLYGDREGYVYAPVKRPDGRWQEFYFSWPEQKEELVKRVLGRVKMGDVYIAPALLNSKSPKSQAFKSSQFVWTEFDGNAPKTLPDNVPPPSIRIQSSTSKHEHWYWRLDEPLTDPNSLEEINRSLTYTLDGDKSAWDSTQVLRPPGTKHRESNLRVKVLSSDSKSYSLGAFAKVLVAQVDKVKVEVTEPAALQETLEKLNLEGQKLFKRKSHPKGSRSSAMTRLAYNCVESDLSDNEIYAILLDADERWGKFKTRRPESRHKALTELIVYCRSNKLQKTDVAISDREEFMSLKTLRSKEINVDWVFENLLPVAGLGVIGSRPGIGKSTLSMRMGFSALTGLSLFDSWATVTKMNRVGYLSLEMAILEVKHFVDAMWPSLNKDQSDLIEENFFVLPLGYSMMLGNKEAQKWLLQEIKRTGLNFLIIDSLKAATRMDEAMLDSFFEWINREIRVNLGITVWIIHHNRKDDKNQGEERSIDDLYGDGFITAHATSVIILTKRDIDTLVVHPVKIRLATEIEPFVLTRGEHLTFVQGANAQLEKKQAPKDNKLAKDYKERFGGGTDVKS